MNKFEKLIEYIINDDDQKARALFHEIVVEKSRDIYESIMDEEVHGNQVEELTDELDKEESIGEDEDEFASDDMGDDMGGEEEVGDEFGGEEEPADEFGGEEEAGDDKIMNIDAKLDELLAKFDEIMGDTGGEEDFGGEEMPADDMGSEEMPMDDMGAEPEQEQFAEAKSGSGNPFAKGSGKSGSAVSGKSGSAKSGTSGKSGNPFAKKTESKQSTTELMREYVDRIGDIYGGAGDESEGTAVGATGKKTSVNGRSITGPGADFGGSTIKRTGADNANPDGKSAPSSDKPQQIKSGNINVPGGKAGGAFKSKEAGKPAEGSTTDGSVPVDKQSVLRQNSGK